MSARAEETKEFYAVVIGTGFAGAVTACRLVQAGHKICVLERGRRYQAGDFPEFPPQVSVEEAEPGGDSEGFVPSPDFSRWFWNIGDGQGLWEIRDLEGVVSAQAAGFGGGSLIYANVHLRAPKAVFEQKCQATDKYVWPDVYRRGEDKLDPYYDRAAYMLDVKPLDPRLNLAKTRQMKRAATVLNKRYEKTAKDARPDLAYKFKLNHISPPLAINSYISPEPRPTGVSSDIPNGDQHGVSDKPSESEGKANRWNRPQKPCDLRGYCWMGCNRQAKNTLDLNYLAIVDDTEAPAEEGRGKQRLADIGLRAEARIIRHSEKDNCYDVIYADHLEGGALKTVKAQHVFLCAGTVNTTELLLRSRTGAEPLSDEIHPNLKIQGNIGDRYFPNADSLATVFDCDQTQNAHIGPTITSSMVFDNGDDWFMVQDGGFPTNLEPLFGLFRSPLWVRRNRFLEQDARLKDMVPFRDWTEHYLNLKKTRPRAYMQLPFGGITRLIRKLPGESVSLMPPQLAEALASDREEILDQIGLLSEERIGKLFDELSVLIDERLDNLVGTLPSSVKAEFKDLADFGVSRGMLRLAAQLVWGSESDLARYVAAQLADDLPSDRSSLVKTIMGVLRWALDYRSSTDRVALLLTMGRDRHPGELYLGKDSSLQGRASTVLRARLPEPLIDTSRITQERSLRDMASIAWHGELRTNPVWTFMHRRFTVHGQGGCSMGDTDDCVTTADGEVRGCPGLYVMDAAAFPASVGVNPSATIAAVAEYKIESFIRSHGGANWQADPKNEVGAWLATQPYADGKTIAELLDPLPDEPTIPKQGAPVSKPVGLEFTESMEGYQCEVSPDEAAHPDIWTRPDADFASNQFLENFDWDAFQRPYNTAENEGLMHSKFARIKLRVEIQDLMRFLQSYQAVERRYGNYGSTSYPMEAVFEASKISVSGHLEFRKFLGADIRTYQIKSGSYLWLFPNATCGKEITQSLMKYRLLFGGLGGNAEKNYVLHGVKVLVDQPGLDVWGDTASLYFDILRLHDSKPISSGILRLRPEDFLVGQIQSFKATNTTDPARQSWALAAFFKFFSGQLSKLYVPELNRIQELIKNIVTQTHG